MPPHQGMSGDRPRFARTLTRGCAVALLWGALVGALAGLFLAAEVLIQNPGIQGFRDRLIVILFFPALYLVCGGVVGAVLGLLTGVVRAGRSAARGAGYAGLCVGAVAGLLLFIDAFGRCTECHQWRDWTWPSFATTPAQSVVNTLLVLGKSLLAGAAIGIGTWGIGRWIGAGARSRWRRWLLCGIGAAACAVLLVFALSRRVPEFRAPRYTPEMARASGGRVRLIVMDGADWDFMRPLLETGRMPHVRSLMQRGVWGELGVADPCVSPYLWTILSTGLSDEYHGLCDFFAYRPPGGRGLITRYPGGSADTRKRFFFRRIAPIIGRRGLGELVAASSRQKRVPELWDYLGAAGKTTCVVGWRYSHPPTPLNGVMVTNKFGDTTAWGPTTYPEELQSALPADFTEATRATVGGIIGARLADADADELGSLAVRVERVWLHIGRDVRMAAVGRALIDSLAPDFSALGLTSVDSHEHFYLLEHLVGQQPERLPLSKYYRRFTDDEQLRIFAPTITRAHAVFDSLVGTLIADAAEEMIVLVSDHGHDTDGSGHVFGPRGIIVMAGGPVRAGGVLEDATVFDVAPTILHAMGLPVPVGFQGRVLSEAFAESWMAANPVRLLAGEDGAVRVIEPGAELPGLSDEELERLRSLGYVD